MIFSHGGPICWTSKRTTIIAQSTVKAEDIALSECAKNVKWIIQLLQECWEEVILPIVIYGGNSGSITLSKNEGVSNRSEHIDIRQHSI